VGDGVTVLPPGLAGRGPGADTSNTVKPDGVLFLLSRTSIGPTTEEGWTRLAKTGAAGPGICCPKRVGAKVAEGHVLGCVWNNEGQAGKPNGVRLDG